MHETRDLQGMPEAIRRILDPFLTDADRALGQGYSAVLYGSAARGDWVEGRSDVNLLLVLDDVRPERLRALGPAFAGWRKAAQEPPLMLSRDEWASATDVFPLEITDMQAAYRVVRGPDPLAALRVAPDDLRHALERELRGKLVRLRQGYVALAEEDESLGAMLVASVPTVLVLLRGVLRLLGRPVPPAPEALVAAGAETAGFDAGAVALAVRRRGERKWRCTPAEGAAYVEAVAVTARFVDQLQLGDQR